MYCRQNTSRWLRQARRDGVPFRRYAAKIAAAAELVNYDDPLSLSGGVTGVSGGLRRGVALPGIFCKGDVALMTIAGDGFFQAWRMRTIGHERPLNFFAYCGHCDDACKRLHVYRDGDASIN